MREFEIRQSIITPEKSALPQFLYLGAHTDDDAMTKLTAVLEEHGFGLTIGTMTDSADYNDALVPVRWQEAKDSGEIGRITEVRRMESPDGSLHHYKDSGIWFAGNLIDDIAPVGIITPHPLDPHTDHEAAFEIGQAVAGDKTPHYTTDTIYGFGKDGSSLIPDLYMPLTKEQVIFENTVYDANTSQQKGSKDNNAVRSMARRRGREMGWEFAAVTFEARVIYENPLRDIFKNSKLQF